MTALLLAVLVQQTHVYKEVDGVGVELDVHGEGDRVLVWVHGGALITGSRRGIPRDLLDLDVRTVSIDYRLAPEVKITAIIEDLKDALAWVRRELKPAKLVIAGGSAGGYLTMMAGVVADPKPDALVAYWGYGDVDGDWYTKPSEHYRTAVPLIAKEEAERAVGKGVRTGVSGAEGRARGLYYRYLRQNGLWTCIVTGFDPETEAEKIAPFCPVRNVTADYPPLLMVHGTKDTDVPYSKSADMARELKKHGVAHELVTVEGAGHGLHGGDRERVRAARKKATDFIRRHLE